MPVSLEHIRDQLFPGLLEVRYQLTTPVWWESTVEAIPLPAVSLKAGIAAAAAAAVIRNPMVTRRFLFWRSSDGASAQG